LPCDRFAQQRVGLTARLGHLEEIPRDGLQPSTTDLGLEIQIQGERGELL
jgi:hypothetical protein